MRWLILDEVIEIRPAEYAATKSHIPSSPVSSELLLLEMMAQTGGLCVGAGSDFSKDLYFAKVQDAQFERNYEPGLVVDIEAWAKDVRSEGSWCEARVTAKDQCLAQAKFLLVQGSESAGKIKKSVTFHDGFMEHFQVRRKIKSRSGIKN